MAGDAQRPRVEAHDCLAQRGRRQDGRLLAGASRGEDGRGPLVDADARPDGAGVRTGIREVRELDLVRVQIDRGDPAIDFGAVDGRRDADVELAQRRRDRGRRFDELAAARRGRIGDLHGPERGAVRRIERVDLAVRCGGVERASGDRGGGPETELHRPGRATRVDGDGARERTRPTRAAVASADRDHLAAGGPAERGGEIDRVVCDQRLGIVVVAARHAETIAGDRPEQRDRGRLARSKDARILGGAEGAVAVLQPVAAAGRTCRTRACVGRVGGAADAGGLGR